MADHAAVMTRDAPPWWRAAAASSGRLRNLTAADTSALTKTSADPQLMNPSTPPSIDCLDVAITGLALDCDTGSVTGSLVSPIPLTYTPGAVRTARGCARVNRDGTVHYTPSAEARRAASRPDAAFLDHHRDTVSVIAEDADGEAVRVEATIAILGF
jgi:hypothetical protein